MLGEFPFVLANAYYAFLAKSKDAQAPVEITFFKDYNQANATYYVVSKGTKRPAAATLFAIWMSTPEAEAIWQSELFGTQKWGESGSQEGAESNSRERRQHGRSLRNRKRSRVSEMVQHTTRQGI